MKLEKICLLFALVLVLMLGVGSVAADNLEESSIISSNDSSIHIDDTLASENEGYLSQGIEDTVLSDSNEIIVEDWDELQYYCSLEDSNYVLKLKENTNYYPTNPSSIDSQIIIKNNVTIMGSDGAYIGDSSPNARNITYTPIKVNDKSGIGIVLQGITFKWISTSYQTDGVFLVMGGNVNNTIKNCTFNNVTTNLGHSSILHIKYGDLAIENCTFINCTTDFGCISVYCPEDDSRGTCTGARMTVTDSYFSDNYAKTEPGCINNCGVLKVYNSTFYRNSAFWWAGAIHTHGGGNTSLYTSRFIDNVAGWNGGALYTYSYLQIYNSTFIGNNCTTDNGGGAIGACKYLHAPYIYVENSLFKDNTNNCWGPDELSSGSGRGGAISIMDEGGIDIRNTTFIHNSASKGSALAIISGGQYGSPDVKIINNTFIDHTRMGDVLYIYVSQTSSCEIRDNTFINSTVEFSKFRIESEDPQGDDITINIDAAVKNANAYDSDVLDKMEYDVYVDGVFYAHVQGRSFVYHFENDEKHDIFITSPISGDVSNTLSISNKKEYIYLSQSMGNDNNNGRSIVQPVKTLSKAIELARDTGYIYILHGSYSASTLNIDYDLEITGEDNSVITGSGNNLFNVTASSLKFKNIIFSGITQTVDRSKFMDSKGKVTFENCKFSRGNYRYYGIDANEVILTNTVFEGIKYYYYLINAPILSADNVSVINNTYIGNGAQNGFLQSQSVTSWNILNSNFEDNINLRIGLIYIKGNTLSHANIKNTVFNSNILLNSNGASQSSCISTECNLNIDKCVFVNNENIYQSSSPRSTVIYIKSACILNVTNSIFANNTYGSGANGIIYASSSNAKRIYLGYNWYGNYLNDASFSPDVNSNINFNAWYALNASTNIDKLGPGEKAIITFDLNNIVYKNGTVIHYSAIDLPKIKLNLDAVNGVLEANEIVLDNGAAQVEFTKIGYDNATVMADYNSCNVTIDIEGTKNTPNLVLEISEIIAGDDLQITVTRPSDATGETILSINGQNYTLTFTDGIAHKTIPQFEAGNYTVKVIFNEDYKYLQRIVSENITVNKLDSQIAMVANSVYVNETLEVSVTALDEMEGEITLYIGDKVVTQELINGQALFSINDLKASDYVITAVYGGNIRYATCENKCNVSIFKYGSSVEISLGTILINTDLIITASVLNDMSGNVTFIINGDSHLVEINNKKAVYTIQDIAKGDYLVEAVYNGDDKYLSSTDSVEFSVGKLNSTVSVNVGNIDYGENAAVEVTVIDGATGNVTVTVDNKSFIGTLNNGIALIKVEGLTAGIKTVSAVYHGDENYLPSSNSNTFTVNKIMPTFNVNANSVVVGNQVTVKINFNNQMRGNFTINIGDAVYTLSISRYGGLSDLTLQDLNPANYNVIATYSGDNNFESFTNYTEFSVSEYPLPQVSNDDQDTQNTHKSVYDAMANGKVLFEIELEDNIHGGIVIDADGNIYFATINSLFSYDNNGNLIWRYDSPAVGNGSFNGVSIGRDMIISPVDGDTLYFINITTGNPNVHSNMYWGSSLFAPVIDENYNVYITSEKQVSENKYRLVIIPYRLWETSSEPTIITLDSFAPISAPIVQNGMAVIPHESGMYIIDIESGEWVSMPIDTKVSPILGIGNTIYTFDGNKLVAINNQQINWETTVTGTVGNNLALDSEIGYLYSVNQEGTLYKYDITNGDKSLVYNFNERVSSEILIDNQGNLYLGTQSGFFYAMDNEGNVLWRVYLAEPITGSPVIDEDGLIYAIVNNTRIVGISNADKEDSKLDAKIDNITVGDDLVVELTFDKSISGEIILSLAGKDYKLPVGNDGKLTANIADLTYGNYTLEVSYSGDQKFKASSITINVSVSKASMDDNETFDIPDADTNSPTYSINMPSDATGNLTVYVDGKVYKTQELVNGKASIGVTNLATGNHEISIVYSGDSKYASISKSVSLHVPLVKLVGSDVTMIYTSGAKYRVRLTSDGVGVSGKTIVFTVNGKTLKVTTDKNGYASVTLNLVTKSAKYTVTASYDKLKASNKVKVNGILSVKNVKVKKSKKVNYIKVTLKKVNGKYLKGKTIKLKINGKTIKAKTNKKGIATFKVKKNVIKKLKVGKKYKFKVTYLKETVTKKVTVKK